MKVSSYGGNNNGNNPAGVVPPPPMGGTAPQPAGAVPPPPMGGAAPQPTGAVPPPPMGGAAPQPTGAVPPPPMGATAPQSKGISLKKGQKIDLTKNNPGLQKIMVGLGWDTNKYDGQADFDLDASAFLLDENSKAHSETDFIFYNNPKGVNDCIVHQGDNLTGEGEGDDEQIMIDFSKIPSNIHRIAITVTIYDYEARKQSFGQVSNAFVRVVDNTSNQELVRYDLGEDFSIETAIIVCELYKNNSEWKFSAIGSGFSGGLGALCKNYGLDAN